MKHVIEVKGLNISYGTNNVVDNISFSVAKGIIFVIAGSNGAGKTSIIEAIEGIRPFTGSILVNGLEPTSIHVKELIGIQLEQMQFDKNIKVQEILQMHRSFYKKQANVEDILARLNLIKFKDYLYSSLSKGWKQKVNIAVALVNDPDVLFFDEVTSGLDPESKQDILQLIYELKKSGKTIVMTSHDLNDIQTIADTILIIKEGKEVLKKDVQELLKNFFCKEKLEYWGLPLVNNGDINYLVENKNKFIIFAKDLNTIKNQILKNKLANSEVSSSSITLVDIYLYYIKQETNKND